MSAVRSTMRRLSGLAVFLALAGAVIAPAAVAEPGTIKISGLRTQLVTAEKGKPLTVRTDRAYFEVVVGDPEIATVQPLTDQSFYILGKKAGTTGIAFFDENQQVVGSIDLEISVDTTRLKAAIRENVPDTEIKVKTTNGQVVLSGEAPDKVSADMAKRIAEKFAGEDDIINSVNVTSSQQVQLNVRFVEINRNAGTELGVKVGGANGAGGGTSLVSFGYNPGNFVGNLIAGGFNIDLAIKAMEDRGLARRLAEPNLVTRSGETANFLAGGEFPIAVTDQDGNVTIDYKKFGVGLEFKPTVLKDGLISLEIEPEVSSIDNSYSFEYPVFLVRRARTSVDLKSGQSFMIAGLYQAENDRQAGAVPGVGRMPVVGSLFSSKKFQRRETDLVMIVTPHLVRPVDPSRPLTTPLDGTRAPTDAETVGLNVDEVKTAATGAAFPKPAGGHILTLEVTGAAQ